MAVWQLTSAASVGFSFIVLFIYITVCQEHSSYSPTDNQETWTTLF